jgi:hypothetical protein
VVNVSDSPRLPASGNLSRRPIATLRPIFWREIRDSARL